MNLRRRAGRRRLAGVLLATVDLSSCYAIDAVTFVALTLFTFFMSPMAPSGDHTGVAMLRAIADGFRYVRKNATAQSVYLADLNAMVFGLPRALFPAMALTVYHGGPQTLGLLYVVAGGGGALHGGVHRLDRPRPSPGSTVAIVVMAWGASMALFGLVHVLWVGLACLAFAGATDVISTVLRNTILQNAITDEFRGRISSMQMAVVTGGPRLGDMESGVVASLTSTEFSIVSGGVACIVGVVAAAAVATAVLAPRGPLARAHRDRPALGVGHVRELSARGVDGASPGVAHRDVDAPGLEAFAKSTHPLASRTLAPDSPASD